MFIIILMIVELKANYTKKINNIVNALLKESGSDKTVAIEGEVPPKYELGDLAFPFFSLASLLCTSPMNIATTVKGKLDTDKNDNTRLEVKGGYLNLFFDKSEIYKSLIKSASSKTWGKNNRFAGEKIMIEFSCPNTNKPLHLGHMRNDALGESVAALLKESGAEVKKVNLVNDRGVHICKSMYAYMKRGNGTTPESEHIKGDHFVGNYYVEFNNMEKEDPSVDEKAQSLLSLWENGDKETIALWTKMRTWVLSGIDETYKRTNVSFDKTYYESELYKLGKDQVKRGLEKGVFYKADDGAIKVDLSPIGLDEKVLLRKDGTSIYITQDIGTAIERHKDWPYTSCIYVVGNEQAYHFKVLFYVLKLLGYDWSEKLYHLSYGMVNLPSGRMKSREGTVVDADDLIDNLHQLSLSAIKEDRGLDDKKANEIAEKVALGALNYFLLSASPSRDMIFDPEASLSFQGNTGPYLLYMGARVSSILRSANKTALTELKAVSLTDTEQILVTLLDSYESVVEKASSNFDPSILATYLYECASVFSKWYHDESILKAEGDIKETRLNICLVYKMMLEKAFSLLGIPFLEQM